MTGPYYDIVVPVKQSNEAPGSGNGLFSGEKSGNR